MLSTKMIPIQGCTNYEDGYNRGNVDGLNSPYNTTIFDEKSDLYLEGHTWLNGMMFRRGRKH